MDSLEELYQLIDASIMEEPPISSARGRSYQRRL